IYLRKIIAIGILGAALASCSTGIESTKPIKMNKEDVKLMAKSEEQKLAESLQGLPLSAWEKGKRFLAMSDRTFYIFEPTGSISDPDKESLSGKILTYEGLDTHVNPDLKDECVIIFSDGSNIFRYRTKKSTAEAMSEIDSSKLPLLSDLDLVESWKEKLKGSALWTKSNLWYDKSGNRQNGLKFAKVTVSDVLPTTGDFPMQVMITGPGGEEAFLQMNYTSDQHDSRNFAAIFSLSDPKRRYPQISEENWALIQKGKVGLGMTKEECKLAIGNPDELRTGHNRVQTMDIWQYSDGTYLFFTDGLLNEFRQ
ncbi:MAG: hypothetical protein K2N35_02285, partial [Muribaculaceae bacterium]|nr:hypothetical protein [Muribaculaceae bacterium]